MTDFAKDIQSHSFQNVDADGISNVDDMFTHLNISQIKLLSAEYQEKIQQTKSDLHTLVGSKYRDLIKIAEDIDDMYAISRRSDTKISNLSYEQANFVSFYDDNFGKFDTQLRQQQAQQARSNSRGTIVRNIINKKLAKLDHKITQDRTKSPLIHTSNFMYYAKVFYTIEQTFPDILENNSSIHDEFYSLKKNLNDYLEYEMACYNVTDSVIHSTNRDRFRHGQRLTLDQLVVANVKLLLQDDYNLIDDDILDDDDNEDDEFCLDKFEVDELVNAKIESYDRNTLPINNYLLAYTILNKNSPQFESFSSVAEKFILLRLDYIQKIMEELVLLRSKEKVEFNKILKFLENTCWYISNYLTTYSGDYFRVLNNITKPWKASSLVGHKSWFDDKVVEVSLDDFSESVVTQVAQQLELSMGNLSNVLFKFVTDLLENSQGDTNGVETLSNTIFIFHNFLVSLKRLEDAMDLSGFDSKLVQLSSGTSLLDEFLSKVASIINLSFEKHLSRLNKPETDGIFEMIKSNLVSGFVQSARPIASLFTNDLVNIMDNDIEQYINAVSNISISSSQEDAGTIIHNWFNGSIKYSLLVSISSKITVQRVDIHNCVSHIIQTFNNAIKKVEWGGFTTELIVSRFDEIKSDMSLSFWEQIDLFVKNMRDDLLSSDNAKVENYFYLIGIIGRLKEKLATIPIPDKFTTTNNDIDVLCNEMFDQLVINTPTSKFNRLFEESINRLINMEIDQFDEIPIRPSLQLTLAMYELANEYCLISERLCNYNIFLLTTVIDSFINSKNTWIEKTLIEDGLMKILKEKRVVVDTPEPANTNDTQEEPQAEENASVEDLESKHPSDDEDNDDPETRDGTEAKPLDSMDLKGRARGLTILANYLFLLHFCNPTIQQEQVEESIKFASELVGVDIDESAWSIVVKGIHSFYRSHKNIYLPLLTSK